MARPLLPIAGSSFTRPINEWINIVNSKKSELDLLLRTDGLKKQAATWQEREFSRLAACSASRPDSVTSMREAGVIGSFREIEREVIAQGGRANLTPDLLLCVNNLLTGTSGTWSSEAARSSVERACDWFSADSFGELHATEQAATVYLRLTEISAFEEHNHPTSLLGASLYTMKAGFPLVMIPPEMEQSRRRAIDEAIRMNTRPMVELIARVIEVTLSDLIEALRRA